MAKDNIKLCNICGEEIKTYNVTIGNSTKSNKSGRSTRTYSKEGVFLGYKWVCRGCYDVIFEKATRTITKGGNKHDS